MTKRFYRYYYSLLNEENKKAYDELYDGFSNMKDSFKISKVNSTDLEKIFEYLMLDNPLIFYLNSYTYYIGLNDIKIKPDYLFSQEEVNKYLTNIKNKCQRYRNINKISDYDFVLEINSLFKKDIKYTDNQTHEIHSIIGSLFNGKAVCDGIAKLFKLVCDLNNIKCIVVAGKSNRSYDRASFYNHAWNKVYVLGAWVNVDLTANMTVSDYLRHDYLFLSDNAIKKSHIEFNKTPICNTDNIDYYTKNNLVFKNKPLLFDYLEKCLVKKKYLIEFKIPYTKDIESLADNVMEVIERVATRLMINRGFNIQYNLDQLVFSIF